jgi:hypothetical protein
LERALRYTSIATQGAWSVAWLGLSESRGNLAYVVRRKSGHEGVRPLLTIERALIG